MFCPAAHDAILALVLQQNMLTQQQVQRRVLPHVMARAAPLTPCCGRLSGHLSCTAPISKQAGSVHDNHTTTTACISHLTCTNCIMAVAGHFQGHCPGPPQNGRRVASRHQSAPAQLARGAGHAAQRRHDRSGLVCTRRSERSLETCLQVGPC